MPFEVCLFLQFFISLMLCQLLLMLVLFAGKFPFKYIGTEGDLQMRFLFYLLKERLFPFVYWNLWTKGMWYGTNGPIKPSIIQKEDENAQHILVGTSSRN
jgi:sulfide:quinone oxidoreductase